MPVTQHPLVPFAAQPEQSEFEAQEEGHAGGGVEASGTGAGAAVAVVVALGAALGIVGEVVVVGLVVAVLDGIGGAMASLFPPSS